MQRTVHVITSQCEAYVAYEGGMARIRITEIDRNLTDPTSFEIEGDPDHIADALSAVSAVLANRAECRKEPN